jgi:puromycin-sensitive aminopeptidase
MLRPIILSIMGRSGDQLIIDEAKKRFKQHLNGDLIDPNIREAVYTIVSFYGDENTQEELRNLYKTAQMTEEKVRLLRSMGQSSNANRIEKTLQFIFEGV